MDNTIVLLQNIYKTLQEVEIKGEKNCAFILGICSAIKQHIQDLETGSVQDDK